MLAYTLLIEFAECDEQPMPCNYAHQCQPWHRKRKEWRFHPRLSLKAGTMHGHLSRITKEVAKYSAKNNGYGMTGEVRIMVVDSDKVEPLWDDAETAAYRLGGVEAVKRLQKGLAAEKRAAERAAARAAKAKLPRKERRTKLFSEIKVGQ